MGDNILSEAVAMAQVIRAPSDLWDERVSLTSSVRNAEVSISGSVRPRPSLETMRPTRVGAAAGT